MEKKHTIEYGITLLCLSMLEKEVYEGIRNCTFLDTEIPGEAREKFVKRLKKEKKEKNKQKN